MAEDTATWTNYDYALMKWLQNPNKNGDDVELWVSTAPLLEPPAAAREFGYTIRKNPKGVR